MTDPLTTAGYQALAQFRYALRRFQRFSERAARDAGLTPAQHQLLLAVRGFRGPGPPSLSDVAEQLQLQLHSVGELVGRAERNDLVERWVDDDDARRTLLRLTPRGEAKLADLSVLHRDELRRFRRDMTDLLQELDEPG